MANLSLSKSVLVEQSLGHVGSSQRHEEIVELISPCSSFAKGRSTPFVTSPSHNFMLPRSHSTSTVLLRSYSRTHIHPEQQINGKQRQPEDGFQNKRKPLRSTRLQNYFLLGSSDLCNAQVWQAALVEFTVSIVMTFASIAAVLACLKANFSFPRIAIAFLQFLIYTASILAAAPVSGGHLNPSFSFATMFTGQFSFIRSILYVVGQSTGSALGAIVVKQVVSVDLANRYFLGGCLLKQEVVDLNGGIVSVGLEAGKGLVAEIAFTFFLISLAFPVGLQQMSNLPGNSKVIPFRGAILIGCLLGLLIFISGELLSPGYTSAGMNPARCFGPAIVQGGSALWHSQWVFWIGPLIAAALFALFYHIAHCQQYEGLPYSDEQPAPHAHSELTMTAVDSHPPPTPLSSSIVPAPISAPIQTSRRLDVFLHIKAMMQKAEIESNKTTEVMLLEEKDVEQASATDGVNGDG